MRPINDLFSTAEACLISDAIDAFETEKLNATGGVGISSGEAYCAASVIDDVQSAIREVHISGQMHDTILLDLPRYIDPKGDILKLLLHLRSSGKVKTQALT